MSRNWLRATWSFLTRTRPRPRLADRQLVARPRLADPQFLARPRLADPQLLARPPIGTGWLPGRTSP
jgi:hypothetical protein